MARQQEQDLSFRRKVDGPIGVRSSVKHKKPAIGMLRRLVLGLSFPRRIRERGERGEGEGVSVSAAGECTDAH